MGPPSLGNLCQCLTTLIVKNFFLKSSLNLPSLSLKPLPLVLLQQAPLETLEGCYKVSPQPSLLQAEQPQLSQPVLVGEVLQPSGHFCGPPLDPLQQLHVLLVLRTPELDAVLQVGSHQSRAEGQNPLPRPAGHASFDAAQDAVGFLHCECTLSAHVQLFIHQYPQGLLHRAALDHIIPDDVLKARIVPAQDAALGLVEPPEVHTGPLLQLVHVPLDDILSWCVNCTTQLGVICKLAEGALDLTVNVIDENIEWHWSQYRPLRDTTPVDCYPLGVTIQPIPYPLNSPPIKSVSLQFREEDVVGDHVHQVVTNLIFPYSGRDFTPLVPNMLSIDSGGKPFLLFFASFAKFSSSCALAFLTPSLHKQAASLYSSQVTRPCFHCLCSSLLLFSLTSMSRLSNAGLFPSLSDFLHLGTESSCALWKASLKICQLCSAPLSLRTVSQGPRLPPILTSPMSSLALVTIRSSIASPRVPLTPSVALPGRKTSAPPHLGSGAPRFRCITGCSSLKRCSAGHSLSQCWLPSPQAAADITCVTHILHTPESPDSDFLGPQNGEERCKARV
ncbi:LOW QUALITY PROTEIN: hypothetical protein QYF61_002184 [Mycteria americana]|uniref:Uncharacterized protein n=1 Tax=Mycteria americana TaxID=33587 RepID=A0AAN7P332_MYCAM|nr:LOW QUALITY PROTEIN: hypothetical protein QYF61_002184 [Mycteria americana]